MLYTDRISLSIYTRVLFHCYTCANVGFDKKKNRTPSVLHGPTIGARNYRFHVHCHWYASGYLYEKEKTEPLHKHAHDKYVYSIIILAWRATQRRRRFERPYYCYVHDEIWRSTKSNGLPCVSLKRDAWSPSTDITMEWAEERKLLLWPGE